VLGPFDEEGQGALAILVGHGHGEGAIEVLVIGEIGKGADQVAQGSRLEGVLEEAPANGLGLVAPAQPVERRRPQGLDIEIDPPPAVWAAM